ncbi:MAG: glucose-6-phosphate dehydrogenase [Thermoleophilia bacterium]
MSAELVRENPLRAGIPGRRTPEAALMVIFGASGDLAQRKLLPSLFRLFREGALPPGFALLGVARRPWSDEEFRALVRESLEDHLEESLQATVWEDFAERLFFISGDPDEEGFYPQLGARSAEIDDRIVGTGNRLYYLAVPPTVFPTIIEGLGRAGLSGHREERGWARVVIEKPFGRDLATARELNELLLEYFREDQVYRIDHYLGKETVQNILVFRFANSIFEPVWNRNYVDHVQITVAEEIGVEDRGPYYEEAGALRDIIQNHVFQLLALVGMEPPAVFEADPVRDEKVQVLRALRPIVGEQVDRNVVRGQYAGGYVRGQGVMGYRDEPRVDPASRTETYVAMRLFVDSWRWSGVPFYLRTGKRLPKRMTEIVVAFKEAPLALFGKEAAGGTQPNVLVIHIQPDEGITLRFASKVPGAPLRIHSVAMDFRYGTTFGVRIADAYERLLLDALLGDATLFTRGDAVEVSWALIDPITERWEETGDEPHLYQAGTWGPREGAELLLRDGREWRV